MRTVDDAAEEVEARTKPKTAKPKATKPEKFPVRLLALDVIKVDHAIQSRVNMSVVDQREFSEAMLRGDTFPPVTVFFDGKVYRLADGFHRVAAAKQAAKVKANLRDIRAEIRNGSKREAIIFSAGANQKFSIRRTDYDKLKSINMLLSDSECWEWAITRIAKHCGCSEGMVMRARNAYSEKHKIAIPDLVIDEFGQRRSAKIKYASPKLYPNKASNDGSFSTLVDGKVHHLGRDKKKAEAKLQQLIDDAEEHRHECNINLRDIQKLLLRRQINIQTMGNAPRSGMGRAFTFPGGILVVAAFRDDARITEVVGRVLLNRQKLGTNCRKVIVCDIVPNYEATAVAKQLGIEFLTPDELVESLKTEAE